MYIYKKKKNSYYIIIRNRYCCDFRARGHVNLTRVYVFRSVFLRFSFKGRRKRAMSVFFSNFGVPKNPVTISRIKFSIVSLATHYETAFAEIAHSAGLHLVRRIHLGDVITRVRPIHVTTTE